MVVFCSLWRVKILIYSLTLSLTAVYRPRSLFAKNDDRCAKYTSPTVCITCTYCLPCFHCYFILILYQLKSRVRYSVLHSRPRALFPHRDYTQFPSVFEIQKMVWFSTVRFVRSHSIIRYYLLADRSAWQQLIAYTACLIAIPCLIAYCQPSYK